MDHGIFKRILYSLSFMFLSLFLFGFSAEQATTEQGLYFVSLEPAGGPVKVGSNSMKLFVGDRKSKAPKEKLNIEIVPWMPAHEHGAVRMTTVNELGKGFYALEGINFSMRGHWEIHVRINHGKRNEDMAVFDIHVK
jgi:hypothetical protein